LVTHIKIYFWLGRGVGRKEGDCQVICGRERSEGFLHRDKLKYRVLMMVVTETE